MTPTPDPPHDHLGIHVIGGEKGESIIVEMPGGHWGVVDCYTRKESSPHDNPTLRFLKQEGIKKLEFLCLTHPHDDHYRGMADILNDKEIKVARFWRAAALTPKDFKRFAAVRWAQLIAKGEVSANAIPHSDECGRILSLVKQKRVKRQFLTQAGSAYPESGLPIGDPSLKFEINAIGPSDDRSAMYIDRLNTCFDEEGRLLESEPELPHNEISLGLHIRFGRTRVILGGDLERLNWAQILTRYRREDLAVHLVKVSHHGSRNGFSKGLWEAFLGSADPRGEKAPLAIIAPSKSHGLPNSDALDHFFMYTTSVYLTSSTVIRRKGSGSLEIPASDDDKVKVNRKGVESLEPRESSVSVGRCSVILDDSGNIRGIDSPPPACRLAPPLLSSTS